MNYLARAIFSLRPASEFTFTDEDYSTIQWHRLDGAAPTPEEIESEVERLKIADIEFASQQAIRKSALLNRLGITEEEAQLLLS